MIKAKQTKAEIELTFKNAHEANAIYRSLKPEQRLPASTRCRVSIRRRKNVLCLCVEAEDTAALRAALNSFLRWAIVARGMIERGEK